VPGLITMRPDSNRHWGVKVLPKRVLRPDVQHQHISVLIAAIRLSIMKHSAVEHVVAASPRRENDPSVYDKGSGALHSVVCERDEKGPEPSLKVTFSIIPILMHLLFCSTRGDFHKAGIDVMVRREAAGKLCHQLSRNPFQPRFLHESQKRDMSVVWKLIVSHILSHDLSVFNGSLAAEGICSPLNESGSKSGPAAAMLV
jgi:hypothetical protein